MSEKLCALKKIGGGTELKETVLWTNPSPTSAFGSQTVTLNQSIDNFKEIAFDYRLSSTNAQEGIVIYTVEEFKTFLLNGTNPAGVIASRVNGDSYTRALYYTDSTHVFWGSAFILSTATSNNTYTIPTKIVGLK